MKVYADLNEDGVCIGIRVVADETALGDGIEIDSYDPDKLMRKYENGSWGDKMPLQFDPGDGVGLKVPIDKIQALETALTDQGDILDDMALAILQSDGVVTV